MDAVTDRVLVMGDALVDLIARISRYPPRGGNTWGTAMGRHPGGTAANFAVGLARLDIPVAFVGKVGNDPYGRFLLEDLQHEGVDTSLTLVDLTAYTGAVFIPVDAEGEHTFFAFVRGGAHTRLQAGDIDSQAVIKAKWIYASGGGLLESPSRETILQALVLTRSHGVPVSFDPNLRLEGDIFSEDLRKAIEAGLRLAEVVLVGDAELALLVDAPTREERARQILGAGPRLVVVKCGA